MNVFDNVDKFDKSLAIMYARLAGEEYAKNGDKALAVKALRRCLEHGVPVPQWVSNALVPGLGNWEAFKTLTIDEALDLPKRDGRTGRKKAHDWEHGYTFMELVCNGDAENLIDRIAEAAENVGMSESWGTKYYYIEFPRLERELETDNQK